jgi:hypothetical protein
MVVCQNYDPPRSTDEQVTDGAQKLVFVICNGDKQEVSASEVVLECGTQEPLDFCSFHIAA